MATAPTFSFYMTLDRGNSEVEIDVSYTATPSVPATFWQPAEGGEVEILTVKHAEGGICETTPSEDDRIHDWACRRADADMAEYAAEAAEYRAEMRRDARWAA